MALSKVFFRHDNSLRYLENDSRDVLISLATLVSTRSETSWSGWSSASVASWILTTCSSSSTSYGTCPGELGRSADGKILGLGHPRVIHIELTRVIFAEYHLPRYTPATKCSWMNRPCHLQWPKKATNSMFDGNCPVSIPYWTIDLPRS